jgi:hypothetical protein
MIWAENFDGAFEIGTNTGGGAVWLFDRLIRRNKNAVLLTCDPSDQFRNWDPQFRKEACPSCASGPSHPLWRHPNFNFVKGAGLSMPVKKAF